MTSEQEFHRRIVEWTVPPPLDRQLATLTVRNTRNDPDSCNVILNAYFGSTRLVLEVDDTYLELDCRIKRAEIRLFAANARLEFGTDFSKYKQQPYAQVDRNTKSLSSGAIEGEAVADLGPSNLTGRVNTKATGAASVEDSIALETSGTKYPFNHIDFHTVSVTGLPGQTYLSGSEVVEYEGWRGSFLASDERVGIAASILVREQWIELSNADLKGGGRLEKALSNIFSSKSSRKAQQFQVLLAFLVRKSLQDPCEKKYATLACHAFVLDPETEQAAVLQRPDQIQEISIHPALVEQFAGLPPGTHEDFVNRVILADASTEQWFESSAVDPSKKLVAPMASVFDVIQALEMLNDSRSLLQTDLIDQIVSIPRNVRRDLTALGFLIASKGRSVDTFVKFQGSARSALMFAAASKDWFVFTASLLEKEGLRFAAFRVGLEVSMEFGLAWSASSQRRYGHNMKRWVAMLHPAFSELRRDHVDYWYVRALKAQSDSKGSIPIIDNELAEEIEYRKLRGVSYIQSSKDVGISEGAFNNWKTKNRDAALEAKMCARDRILGEGKP